VGGWGGGGGGGGGGLGGGCVWVGRGSGGGVPRLGREGFQKKTNNLGFFFFVYFLVCGVFGNASRAQPRGKLGTSPHRMGWEL